MWAFHKIKKRYKHYVICTAGNEVYYMTVENYTDFLSEIYWVIRFSIVFIIPF
jgi:hypothetical protein